MIYCVITLSTKAVTGTVPFKKVLMCTLLVPSTFEVLICTMYKCVFLKGTTDSNTAFVKSVCSIRGMSFKILWEFID